MIKQETGQLKYAAIAFDCEGNKIKSSFETETEAEHWVKNHGLELFSIERKVDCYQIERQKLLEEASQFRKIPPFDYSKLTNEEIRRRTEMLRRSFDEAFEEDDDEDEDI